MRRERRPGGELPPPPGVAAPGPVGTGSVVPPPSGRTVSVVAGADLPHREARALVEYASRDPRVWRNIALTWLTVVAALGVALVVSVPGLTPVQQHSTLAATGLVIVMAAPTTWVSWYLTLRRKVRHTVATQSPPGTVIGSRITADTVTFAVGEAAYSYTYEALSRVVQVGDVLVVKPRHRLVLAVPVEAVSPDDLAHLLARVVNEPMSLAARS
ncbi:hypothetical protein ASD62_16340 [Phycicoccus sp. Root563]|nr:hypothetical protein ASD62_16340 [Phycicoccus sp. Root563]